VKEKEKKKNNKMKITLKKITKNYQIPNIKYNIYFPDLPNGNSTMPYICMDIFTMIGQIV
jgi:hypothetical protein